MKKIFHGISEWIKNHKLMTLSFICAFAVINIIYVMFSIAPYGDHSTLYVDFYHQYGPMLGELYDRIRGFDSLVYSFTMGMGLPFFRNFLNYLSSPFNLIMLLFNRSNLVMSYGIIIGFKAIASCMTMTYFLSKEFNTKSIVLVALGLSYAFSAYFAAYYWNIMWLDGMVFLPLITLGIENIVNKKTWKLYSISLAIMLMANYYIGYMICIYSVVYFLFYVIYKTDFLIKDIKKELWESFKKCLMFAGASLIAGALVACLLIPMFKSTASISATGGTIPTTQYYGFTFIDYLMGHLSITNTVTFASDTLTYPNVSCGILGVALFLLFIINPKIKVKTKVIYLLILSFFFGAFFIPQLDYIIQAFHVPNDLPYRYSFIYIFLMVTIGGYALTNIKKVKFPVITFIYVLLMCTLIYISQFSTWPNLEVNNIYINMIILTLFFIFYACDYYLDKLHNLFYISIVITVMIDAVVSINYNWNITQDINQFNEDYKPTIKLLEDVDKYDKSNFYRIENIAMMTLNDSSWYGYNGMTTFSSMAYENMAKLQNNLGMPGNEINSYYYVQQTPIYDLMFDMKYFIGATNDIDRYKVIAREEEQANEFIYNVGLGFGVNRDIKNWMYTGNNPFAIQNDFIKRSTGITNVLEENNLIRAYELYQDDEFTLIKYTYENTGDNMYLYSANSAVQFMIVGDCLYNKDDDYLNYINTSPEIIYSYTDNYAERKIINIKSTAETVDVIVGYKYYYDPGIKMFTINQDKFQKAYDILNRYSLDITEFKESSIKGNIYLDDNMTVYTSIPYDAGWHVYVDDKEVDTFSIGNALLAFNADKGTHKIKMVYRIPYFRIGLVFSVISLLIMIFSKNIAALFNKVKPKKKHKHKIKEEK